ncbi:Lipoprotein-releasing system ATP-binding protein LolD [Planctomycetales bacterium 10988]|nr:Lipoprotein-releasing system ATP-binding protein LolD [Planctomycetales bacterium 10988]
MTSTKSINEPTMATTAKDSPSSIEAKGLCHSFGEGDTKVQVLHGVEFSIRRGEVIILMGPSGSGKTTVLTLVGCLRSVQEGSVQLLGEELNGASETTLTQMRRRLGFIFQAHNLHESLTAAQNVGMGLEVHGIRGEAAWRPASERVLELVGLGERIDFLPEKLSGGQKQRVAVARALVGNPEIIFADEPTAALDKKTSKQVVSLLRRLADERQTTVLMVTHDHRVLDVADRILMMEDGRIVEEKSTSESIEIPQ